MLSAALTDTLNIKFRREVQPRPVYDLVLAKDGPKFPEHKAGPDDPPDDQKIVMGDSPLDRLRYRRLHQRRP